MDESSKARGAIGISIFVLLGCTLIGVFLVKPDPVQQGNINLIIGGLLTALGLCTQFYFGSSSGSKALAQAQSETVKTLTDAVATSAPVVIAPPNERVKAPPAAAPVVAEPAAPTPKEGQGLPEFIMAMRDKGSPLSDYALGRIWMQYNETVPA